MADEEINKFVADLDALSFEEQFERMDALTRSNPAHLIHPAITKWCRDNGTKLADRARQPREERSAAKQSVAP
jgi:hypothetical protein